VADTAEIGVFGGSGFYSLLDDVREIKVDTPYGAPSDSIFLAEVAGRRVAFLPRHGRRHTIPPHRINYRANVWAMKALGVKAAISPCAAGSLALHVKPGDFVICGSHHDRARLQRNSHRRFSLARDVCEGTLQPDRATETGRKRPYLRAPDPPMSRTVAVRGPARA
jgi:purine nucleoside phosphorylase